MLEMVGYFVIFLVVYFKYFPLAVIPLILYFEISRRIRRRAGNPLIEGIGLNCFLGAVIAIYAGKNLEQGIALVGLFMIAVFGAVGCIIGTIYDNKIRQQKKALVSGSGDSVKERYGSKK
jgi:hypothetical protein